MNPAAVTYDETRPYAEAAEARRKLPPPRGYRHMGRRRKRELRALRLAHEPQLAIHRGIYRARRRARRGRD